jgi:hypothetical protein
MILLGKIALGFAGVALAGVGLVCSEGLIEVNVVEKQPEKHHIYVLAPALLVPVGMHFAPKHDMAQASREIQPWLPTIRAALDELRRSNNLTLVEVKEQGQHVRIAKSGGALTVDVEDEDETVHVSAPIRAISSSVEELAAAAPAAQSQP